MRLTALLTALFGGLALAPLAAAPADPRPPRPANGRVESKPVAVRGLEFRTTLRPPAALPAAGASELMELALIVRNTTAEDVTLNLFDTLRIDLLGPDGKAVPGGFGRDGKKLVPPVTVAAGKEESFARTTRLVAADALRVWINDPSGGEWSFGPVKPGVAYSVRLTYENTRADAFPGVTCWAGKAAPEAVRLTLPAGQ